MKRTKRIKLGQAGFTLPELIISITLMMILSLMLANFIVTWMAAATLAQARTELLTNAENALDTITEDIRLSGSADQNNRWPDTNGPSGNQFGWASSGSTLVLAKAAVDHSNTIIFSDPAQYITQKDNEIYYLNNGTLYRRTLKSTDTNDAAVTTCPPASATATCPADRTIATNVSNFSVTYYDSDLNAVTPDDARAIQLSITMSKKINGKAVSASYNTRMVFRNE
jgi:prepilin-type N-terminal cleavage/methylation domain-containing protein